MYMKFGGMNGQMFIENGHLTIGIFLDVSLAEFFSFQTKEVEFETPRPVKRGILWQQKDKLFSRSVVFVC
jgi:hypothetical protein